MTGAPCGCDESRDLRRRLEIAQLQLERLRLHHICPPAADEKGRRAWDKSCRWIDSKLEELSR